MPHASRALPDGSRVMGEPNSEQAVAHLQDARVLRGFAEFGSIHRAQLADKLWADFRQQREAAVRRSLALEIVSNYVAQLEDTLHWVLALQRWHRERQQGTGLFDCVDSAHLEKRALDQIARWTIADLRRELGFPRDDELERRGYSEANIRLVIQTLRIVLVKVQEAVQDLRQDEGILPLVYHKTKHGILAIPADAEGGQRNALVLASRRGPAIREGEAKKKINFAWLEAVEEGVAGFVKKTYAVSDGIWTIANLLYLFKFDSSWEMRPWPYPQVEV